MAQRLLNWGGKFALEIAPLLGLAGKLAGATSCCLSTVVTANRAHYYCMLMAETINTSHINMSGLMAIISPH